MIYPPFANIRKSSAHIAAGVAAKAYELGGCSLHIFLCGCSKAPPFLSLKLKRDLCLNAVCLLCRCGNTASSTCGSGEVRWKLHVHSKLPKLPVISQFFLLLVCLHPMVCLMDDSGVTVVSNKLRRNVSVPCHVISWFVVKIWRLHWSVFLLAVVRWIKYFPEFGCPSNRILLLLNESGGFFCFFFREQLVEEIQKCSTQNYYVISS